MWKINVYFLSQILIEKKIYCEYKGNISNFLNNSLHESLALECTLLIKIMHLKSVTPQYVSNAENFQRDVFFPPLAEGTEIIAIKEVYMF